uniref:DUF4795 domain-containing protein n=1 Tax=Anopheles farauti TaxID=69004 RepID=A0A182QNS9_9DIPT
MAETETTTCAELLVAAFGTPESGDLNFTALRQLLMVILRKLDLENVLVDQILNDSVRQQSPSVPIEKSPESELESTTSSGEQLSDAGCALAEEPVIAFEESEAYKNLLMRSSQIETTVEDLKGQLVEQAKISKAILPTIEEFEQFRGNRSSCLQSVSSDTSVDYLSIAARLDKIDETIGKLAAMANDTVLEYARLEKTIHPYLDGGELTIMRAQLDNINHLLKSNFPGYRVHCSSLGILKPSRPSTLDDAVPIDFYQHPAPSTLKSLVPRRSTIKLPPEPDVEKELETIRTVLAGLIARLPLPAEPEIESENSSQSVTSAFELSAESIRAIWPRGFEELLRSNHERLEALEQASDEQRKFLDGVAANCDANAVVASDLKTMVENFRSITCGDIRSLEQEHGALLNNLDERCSRGKAETNARLDELSQQLENRVDYEHFRTRVSKETFTKTIEELHGEIEVRAKDFTTELEAIVTHLNVLSSMLETKFDKEALVQLETRLRRRFNHLHLMMGNVRCALRSSIEAAGTKIQLGPEALRCVSCNHATAMRTMEELIPTGKALLTAEQRRESRIKRLNRMARQIVTMDREKIPTPPVKQGGSTTKAKMTPPAQLVYKVHAPEDDT